MIVHAEGKVHRCGGLARRAAHAERILSTSREEGRHKAEI
jgi:hypothetical protein